MCVVFRAGVASEYGKLRTQRHMTLTAETHNFPTAVSPFSGATTGKPCQLFQRLNSHFVIYLLL